jgi:hypothetical protein
LALALLRGGCVLQLGAEIAQHVRGALDDPAARHREAQIPDLGAQVPLVPRQVLGQVHDLSRDDRAEPEQGYEQQHDHRQDRRDPPQTPAAQPDHDRRQHEAEQDGERERDQDLAADVKSGDHHDQPRDHRRRRDRRGGGAPGHGAPP